MTSTKTRSEIKEQLDIRNKLIDKYEAYLKTNIENNYLTDKANIEAKSAVIKELKDEKANLWEDLALTINAKGAHKPDNSGENDIAAHKPDNLCENDIAAHKPDNLGENLEQVYRFARGNESLYCRLNMKWDSDLLNWFIVKCRQYPVDSYRVHEHNTFKLEEVLKSSYALSKHCKTNNEIGVTCIEQTESIFNLADSMESNYADRLVTSTDPLNVLAAHSTDASQIIDNASAAFSTGVPTSTLALINTINNFLLPLFVIFITLLIISPFQEWCLKDPVFKQNCFNFLERLKCYPQNCWGYFSEDYRKSLGRSYNKKFQAKKMLSMRDKCDILYRLKHLIHVVSDTNYQYLSSIDPVSAKSELLGNPVVTEAVDSLTKSYKTLYDNHKQYTRIVKNYRVINRGLKFILSDLKAYILHQVDIDQKIYLDYKYMALLEIMPDLYAYLTEDIKFIDFASVAGSKRIIRQIPRDEASK